MCVPRVTWPCVMAKCLLAPVLALVVAVSMAEHASGEDLLPPDRPVQEVIDHYVDLRLKQENVTAAPQADDANFLRRVMLDLAGRIPTAAEGKQFAVAASESPLADRRAKLVERLLAAPDFARHLRNEFDAMLSLEGKSDGAFRAYLLKAVQENRPWDRMFRELLTGQEKEKDSPPELAFLKTRASDLDRLTADVSSLFFGVNISCAQCHNHPLVPDWKQDHFFGLKSFLAATYVTKAKHLGERDEAEVKFKTTKGLNKEARLMFLTGTVVDVTPAKLSDKDKADLKKRIEEAERKKQPPPPPRFSRRAKLVEVALNDQQNRFFARSIVNRIWKRLLGHGLVNPVDQMHSENPPTHPELLEWLARDMVSHNYDLKGLIRGIVLSRAYARCSRWERGALPSADLFAVAQVRALTPRQLGLSLIVATSAPGTIRPEEKPGEWDKRLEQLENQAAGLAGSIEAPTDGFQISVTEALLFSNSQRVWNEYLGESGDRLVGRLKTIKDRSEAIETAVWNVLCRAPDADEVKTLSDYLARRESRLGEAYKQVVWALLTNSEFRFNH
jgi:hypothetical protein